MAAANEPERKERPADLPLADPLGPILEAIRSSQGLPPAEAAARIRAVLPPAVAEVAESNQRLRDLILQREALAVTAISMLRAAAEALRDPGRTAPERAEEAARLRQVADDLARSLEPGEEPGEGDPRPIAPRGTRSRVLVVDDDADVREALELTLDPDYEVVTAVDGRAAIDAARSGKPDLVLMDLFMPRMDGLQALEQLRRDPVTADIPVIFVSARGDDAVKAKTLDLGAADFLQKPFSERELRARLERTLRLSRAQNSLRELAQTDPLTGLANLRAFRARLEEEAKRARRYRTPLTCVMADMDHLKAVNDGLGHAAGDRAIAAVAAGIRAELRETDFGARYGGDEFVVLLPHTAADEGRFFAERACARLRATVLEVGGRRIPLGASFGVASLPGDSSAPAEAVVRAADAALYRAKRAGRGCVAVATLDEADGGAPATS